MPEHKARKDAKVREQKENILKQKGTPLETLIKKVKTLNGGANADADYLTGHADPATSTESTDYEADKKDRLSIAKEKLGKAFSLTCIQRVFKGAPEGLAWNHSAIAETAPLPVELPEIRRIMEKRLKRPKNL